MVRFSKLLAAFLLALGLAVMTTGCGDDDDEKIPTELAFAGSETCAECHSTIHTDFVNSGHPYKLVKVDGAAPTYPFSSVPNPPAGYTWDDITYVIGGYAWKARFIDTEGFIITGDGVQYNLATQGWVAYSSSDPLGTKKYNCGSCHTTGWKSVADGGTPQDGLAGMDGEFFAGGIQCEACHGMGNIHAVTESADDITVDNTSAACGNCHIRGASSEIPASGGFIKHHEQYNEILSAGHASRQCVDCHNPHGSTKHNQTTGIVADCLDCHPTKDASKHSLATLECEDCHMPAATKSAVASTKYVGDVATHIFKINVAADGEMFNADGSLANGSTGVTLDFTCYQCHKDVDGIGGSASTKTLQELSDYATDFHDDTGS